MLTKRNLIAGLLAITLLAPQLQGQDTAPKPSYTLIKNVKIYYQSLEMYQPKKRRL